MQTAGSRCGTADRGWRQSDPALVEDPLPGSAPETDATNHSGQLAAALHEIEYLDTGVVLTAPSKVGSAVRGFVRLSWDTDSWASDANGLTKPGPPAYKSNLVDGFPFGALVGRVGAIGELFSSGRRP